MRIVVSHLTRMDAPRICVAGIEPDTGRHIRPTSGQPLTRTLLAEEDGPFALGALVDLGDVKPDPNPPETEDHLFWPNRARLVGRLSPNRYLDLIRANARHSLRDLFGEKLERHKRNYAIEAGHGVASLGILKL